MRIGFDAKRIFQNATGLGNYSRAVVKNLAALYPEHEYFLFTPNASHRLPFETSAQVQTVVGRGSVWRSFGIRRDMIKHKIDVFHGLSNELPFSINKADVKSVVTIHDLIFGLFPHHYPGVDRTVYELKTKFAVNHADVIVAASESTKRDIVATYHTAPERIQVIYQTCDDLFYRQPAPLPETYALPDQFMLYVGSVTERKNLLAVVHAYKHLSESDRIPCVIVGQGKRYAEEVKAAIVSDHLEKYFLFLQDVPTEHLPALYAKALLFIYPSLYEGFGIPILESMVVGCPVITSNVSSLPEVGGDAALYFNPADAAHIAQMISKTIQHPELRTEMINKGRIQAARFTKSTLTRQLIDVYQS